MINLYYILTTLILAIAGPFLLLKKKARAGLAQKFGRVPADLVERSSTLSGGIWIHAVSVGEFNAVWPLVERLKEEYPYLPLLLSTTTATGQKLAQDRAGHLAEVFYFPLDVPFATRRWLQVLKPSVVAIAETELWPGFVHECRTIGLPLVAINGRISPSSFKTYHALRVFFGSFIRQYAALGVQTESEWQRYRAIAGADIPVTITGNLKLDGLVPQPSSVIEELRTSLGIGAEDFVIVAGSTHEGEEQAILHAYKGLLWKVSNSCEPRAIKLIIAPRHPERFARVKETVAASGYRVICYSEKQKFENPDDVYVLDALGQLNTYYGLGSVAFVGGTLAKIGGHNVAEPYAYSVPVVCGPHLYKTRDIARSLKEISALDVVHDQAALTDSLVRFYEDPSSIVRIGRAGKEWIVQNQGAVNRTLTMLRPFLSTGQRAKKSSDRVRPDGDFILDGEEIINAAYHANSGARK